jgi:hypothetical protein
MKTFGVFCFMVCMALIGFSLGCSADAKHGTVSGTVTFDGQPLKSGTIRFDSEDGRAAAADGSIVDGKFSVKVLPGDKRVSITSPKVVGKKKMYDLPDSPVYDVTEELIPKRYNANTELKLSVKAGKQDAEPSFDLKSK